MTKTPLLILIKLFNQLKIDCCVGSMELEGLQTVSELGITIRQQKIAGTMISKYQEFS